MQDWIREQIFYTVILLLVLGMCAGVAWVGLTVIEMLEDILL